MMMIWKWYPVQVLYWHLTRLLIICLQGAMLCSSLFVINLLSRQIYSLGFLFLFFGHYLQQTLKSQNHLHSGLESPVKSGMVFGAAAEGPAPDVISQLFYKFWILLLYLLSKLLSPVSKDAKWYELGDSQSYNSHAKRTAKDAGTTQRELFL